MALVSYESNLCSRTRFTFFAGIISIVDMSQCLALFARKGSFTHVTCRWTSLLGAHFLELWKVMSCSESWSMNSFKVSFPFVLFVSL